MYSAAVYTISQSYCRTAIAENNPLASMSARRSGTSPGRGQVVPGGKPSPISSYTGWISRKNGSPSSGTTCTASQKARCPPGRSARQARA